jgi:chromosome transmission fidelity protein 4
VGDGMGSVVVATTKGYVRFLSSSGIQRYLWRVGEEVVSMVAGKDAVMVIHQEGGTSLDGASLISRVCVIGANVAGSQNLRYTIIDLSTFELIQEGRVPLPRKALLSWIGFSRDNVSPSSFHSWQY